MRAAAAMLFVAAIGCGDDRPVVAGPGPTSSSAGSGAGGNGAGGSGSGGSGPGGSGAGGHASLATFCDTIDVAAATKMPSEPPETVVSGLDHPVLVAVDDARIYWAASPSDNGAGQIGAAPKAGGAAELLSTTFVNGASGLVLAGDLLFWSNRQNGNLMQVPKAGGSVEVFATSGPVGALAAGETLLFATTATIVLAYPFAGGEPSAAIGDRIAISAVASRGDGVFATDTGLPMSGEFSAGEVLAGDVVLATDVNRPMGVAVDGGDVVWLDGGTTAKTLSDGAIYLIAEACGDPVAVVTGIDTPWAIRMADTTAFWTSLDGEVWSLDLIAGTLTPHARDGGSPRGLAVDATHVYWADSAAGEVRRSPR